MEIWYLIFGIVLLVVGFVSWNIEKFYLFWIALLILIVSYISIRIITRDKVIYSSSNQHSGFRKIFSHSCKKPC